MKLQRNFSPVLQDTIDVKNPSLWILSLEDFFISFVFEISWLNITIISR